MYVAMNRFKIKKGKEQIFEDIWRNRDSHLENVNGFVEFHLLKGETEDEITLYASHTIWKSRENFINWIKSENFRRAHKGAGKNTEIYVDHPKFEGFEAVI